jgi:two-component system response regulator HydG
MSHSHKKESILVVDDSSDTLEILKRNLMLKGYQVFTSSNVPRAIEILDYTPVDLVITDLKMPRVGGLDLVRHVRENFKYTEIIMITGYPSVESAVKAVKTGAEDYLAKPFTDEELFTAVRNALEKLHLFKAAQGKIYSFQRTLQGIIGESKVMQKVIREMSKAASTSATLLITGESGTGKELIARAIHYNGPRVSAPFVPVNCGGIPDQLLESELFGYVKGAFTGAVETRAGFFQTADGGTIFLDEIGNTTLSMQAKLLRVLEDKQVYMLGSRQSQKVDVRIIAATNKDLSSMVEKDTFREDLYYRLNVIMIELPSLRKRRNDILLLIHHFASTFAKEFEKPTPKFSDNALQVLKSYHWPGNVRELENVIQRLVVMTDGDIIDVPDLPSLMRFSALHETGLDRPLAEVEAEYISNVLTSVDGNKSRAAKILGIDRKTLRNKLKQYNLF